MKTKEELIEELIDLAFAEDIGDGDHTTFSTIPEDAIGEAQLIIKEDGIVAGVQIACDILKRLDPSVTIKVYIQDGIPVHIGDIVFKANGNIRALLMAERTLLNIMQRMSGVATITNRYQKELEGLNTKVLDTRKTTPGMRMLEKEAVALGGGKNHRIGLYDMILIKDNHIDFAGSIEKAIRSAQKYKKDTGREHLRIEVEVRNLEDIRKVMEIGGIDRIMFDNFTPALTREAVLLVNGTYETESSGGITLSNLREYGLTGVDFISVGALTHSTKGLDMSFKAIKSL